MICNNCGNTVDENSKFCGMCGALVQKEQLCSSCGEKISSGMLFCPNCGAKQGKNTAAGISIQQKEMEETNTEANQNISSATPASKPKVVIKTKQSSSANNYASASNNNVSPAITTGNGNQTGKLLRKMNGVTKFNGEPVAGVANKIGTLSVYDDRVEFVRKAGLTLVGTVNALANQNVETYYYSDCSSITNGNYLVVYVTLVLNMKNGNKLSFCPALPGTRDMEDVANLIRHYF